MGRKSTFIQETADSICDQIANGMSVREICRQEEMPSAATVFKWLSDFPSFAEQYARAKAASADAIAEEILDIADNATNDWMERNAEEGSSAGFVLNGEHVQRSKLRIESRKWLLAKLQPKKYGDKLQVGGAEDLPPLQGMSDDLLLRRAAELLKQANASGEESAGNQRD